MKESSNSQLRFVCCAATTASSVFTQPGSKAADRHAARPRGMSASLQKRTHRVVRVAPTNLDWQRHDQSRSKFAPLPKATGFCSGHFASGFAPSRNSDFMSTRPRSEFSVGGTIASSARGALYKTHRVERGRRKLACSRGLPSYRLLKQMAECPWKKPTLRL